MPAIETGGKQTHFLIGECVNKSPENRKIQKLGKKTRSKLRSLCESSNGAAGKTFSQIFSFLGHHHTDNRGTECFWVTFSEFQRGIAIPKGKEPSILGTSMTTYYEHVMILLRTEMLRLPRLQAVRSNLPENHTQIFCILCVFTHSAIALMSCSVMMHPAASGRGFLGAALVAVGYAHLAFVSMECGLLLTLVCLKKNPSLN